MAEEQAVEPARLARTECREAAQGDATGWRTYRTVDDEVAVYGPGCAAREVGEDEV
jgi:hypothetical protein